MTAQGALSMTSAREEHRESVAQGMLQERLLGNTYLSFLYLHNIFLDFLVLVLVLLLYV